MTNSLFKLIDLICCGDFVSVESISERLRAVYEFPLTLEEGVERLCCKLGFDRAIDHLFDSNKDLFSLVKSVDSSCPEGISRANAIQILLRELKLTIPPETEHPHGVHSIKQKIVQDIADTEESILTERAKQEELRRRAIDGWTYVEQLLVDSINFYASMLSVGGPVEKKFKEAKKASSLGRRLSAMSEIEELFLTVIEDSTGKVFRVPKELTGQPLPLYGREKPFKVINSFKVIHIPQELNELSSRLYGRESPFAGFPFQHYKKSLGVHRNRYAHETPEMLDRIGMMPIKESLEIALNLVNELIELAIAPSVVYLTAHGSDEYGREIIWFVDERYITMPSIERRKYEFRMFKPNLDRFQKLTPYMTVTWPKDLMYDPPLVPLHIEEGDLADAGA